jgi:hypothetical protein
MTFLTSSDEVSIMLKQKYRVVAFEAKARAMRVEL